MSVLSVGAWKHGNIEVSWILQAVGHDWDNWRGSGESGIAPLPSQCLGIGMVTYYHFPLGQWRPSTHIPQNSYRRSRSSLRNAVSQVNRKLAVGDIY